MSIRNTILSTICSIGGFITGYAIANPGFDWYNIIGTTMITIGIIFSKCPYD